MDNLTQDEITALKKLLSSYEFIANWAYFKGEKGDKGDCGETIVGPQGVPGKDGISIRGNPGENGRDGKPAPPIDYELIIQEAVKRIPVPKDGRDGVNGESIKGDQGICGIQGEPGPMGPPGKTVGYVSCDCETCGMKDVV